SIGTGSSSGHLLDHTLTGSAQAIEPVPGLVVDSGTLYPSYTWCRTEKVFSQEFREELFRSILYMGVIPPGIPLEIWGEVSLGLKFSVQSYLETRLSPFAPLPGTNSNFEMTYALDSNVQISVPAGISADIIGGLASVAIRLVPSAEFHLQPYIVVDDSGVDSDYALDTEFALAMEIEACLQTVILGEQCAPTLTLPLVEDVDILPPYGTFQTPASCGSGSGTSTSISAGPTPPAGGLEKLSNPVAITSPDGSIGMTMWVIDGDTLDQIVEVRITEGDEVTTLTTSIPGAASGFLFIDPTATFVDNDTIVLAGMSRPASFSAEEPPADVADPDFFTIRNANVAYTEIRLGQIVRVGDSWGIDLVTPLDASDALGTPTVDRRADGRPSLAGRGQSGEALLAWVRYQDDYLIDDGQVLVQLPYTGVCPQVFCNNPEPVDNIRPQMEATSIAVRQVGPLGPLPGSAIEIISDPGINVQPSVAYSPSGAAAYCVWIHDPTHTDLISDNTGRFLKGAVYDAVTDVWSAPFDVVAFPDDYPGMLEPSIVLSSDDDGLVAFTAIAAGSPSDRTGLNGGSRLLFTARLIDGVFDEPVELRGECGERIYGWGPTPLYIPDETYALGPESQLPNPEIYMSWSEFGIPGTESGSGNVMISCLETGATTWSAPMRLLPAGEGVISNVAMTVVGGQIETAYFDAGEANPGAAPFGPTVAGFKSLSVDREPDLAVRCEVTHPFAGPGAQVEGRAVVVNQGLIGSPIDNLGQSLTGLEIVLVAEDGSESIVEALPLPVLAPGARTRILFSVEMPHDPAELLVRVVPNPVDRDRSNDAQQCYFGAPSPHDLQCTPREEVGASGQQQLTTLLEWTNPIAYDRIELYRNGMLLHTLPGSIETFVDTTARTLPTGYDLRGIVGASRSRKVHLDCEVAALSFLRGDTNADSQSNIADAVFLLEYLFVGGAVPSCFASADISFDGNVNIADVVNLLAYLFQQGTPPAAPFPDCGDSSAGSDELLGCDVEGC
ncbi:MAG: dockerin type I repeat-containing protein, partial [Planctomycetota bacterium]